jgi:glycosyltransferase involved in cell wall biosynthesis
MESHNSGTRHIVTTPAVSIVMATYNRPAALGFAIRSVLAQDFDDWELTVVGDRCTAATAELVASFADERIRYVNLAINHGEQSGPNNVGIARANGRYIAFLNHDDLWFADHLRAAVDWLEACGADAVIARSAKVMPADVSLGEAGWYVQLTGQGRHGRYDPVRTEGPLSSLLAKSEVARAIGPMRSALDCFTSSSQEWLFRIWKRGFDVRTMPHLTVLQVPSGVRAMSYRDPDTPEHAFFAPRFADPAGLRTLLLDRLAKPRHRPLWRRLARPVARSALRLAAHAGFCPNEVIGSFQFGWRRGSFINGLRRIRGLPEMPDPDPPAAKLRERYAREREERDRAPPSA